MRRRMKNAQPKSKHYEERLIGIDEYLATFLGVTLDDEIDLAELNEIHLYSMPNRWSKQAYVQGLDCGYISSNRSVNM